MLGGPILAAAQSDAPSGSPTPSGGGSSCSSSTPSARAPEVPPFSQSARPSASPTKLDAPLGSSNSGGGGLNMALVGGAGGGGALLLGLLAFFAVTLAKRRRAAAAGRALTAKKKEAARRRQSQAMQTNPLIAKKGRPKRATPAPPAPAGRPPPSAWTVRCSAWPVGKGSSDPSNWPRCGCAT